MKRHLRTWATALSVLTLASPVGAQDPTTRELEQQDSPRELIVLLAPGADAPAPEELTAAVEEGRSLPGRLAAGAPVFARPLISERVRGAALEALHATPDRPEAMLQRYVVLTYALGTDLDAVARTLRESPHVLHVGPNRRVGLSAEPNDTFYSLQWGLPALNLPTAWDTQKGHAYVAVVDLGIDTDHPDHVDFDGAGNWIGGNYRPFLSKDYGHDDANPDSGEHEPAGCMAGAPGCRVPTVAGHGTHVAGIVAAHTDNDEGVAGVCQDCSLMIGKFTYLHSSGSPTGGQAEVIAAINGSIDRGAQVLTMSLGWRPDPSHPSWCTNLEQAPDCVADPMDSLCVAVDLADDRDVVVTAASGNDGSTLPDFPASDSRVLGVAGIQADGQFWNDCSSVSCECGGSNYDPTMFNTPAKDIQSTFYIGLPYVPSIPCDDSGLPPNGDGYGPCTGTSMAAPHLAGVSAILRSANPLLSKDDVETLLAGNLDNPPGWNPAFGRGKPDADAALDDALGQVAGQTLANRLTPLFDLYSWNAETHLSTTAPQMASAALLDSEVSYFTEGNVPLVPGYDRFPGTICVIGPCTDLPRAYVYLFTSDEPPTPGAQLVPLYRMGYDQSFGGNPLNRSFFYTTETGGLELGKSIGYEHMGIEGYIYPRCTPEPSCIPAGATRLYRLYHEDRDDYSVFPESQLAHFQSLGYISQPSLNDWIGYVYETVDSDGDHVIDGFEGLIGTNPSVSDSDGDGASDGQEILDFPYSDPLDGPTCDTVFADSFDSGDTAAWTQALTGGAGQLAVLQKAAIVGPYGLASEVSGAGDSAWVRDNSPASETFYRLSFHFRLQKVRMLDGNQHNIVVARDDNPSAWVVLVALRRSGSQYQLRARTRLDSGSVVNTPWITIGSTVMRSNSVEAEVVWDGADPGQSNGSLTFSVAGTTHLLSGLDNDTRQIDHLRFGTVSGVDAGTEGRFDFDELESCRN